MIPRFRRSRKPPDLSIDELYRRYGMVMEQAQLFEQVVRGHGRRREFLNLREMGSSAKVLRDLERIDGMTIGAVQHKYKLPEDEEAIVTFARKLRNELAHDFFASIDKHSTEGRLKAAGRLLAYSRMFHAAPPRRRPPGRSFLGGKRARAADVFAWVILTDNQSSAVRAASLRPRAGQAASPTQRSSRGCSESRSDGFSTTPASSAESASAAVADGCASTSAEHDGRPPARTSSLAPQTPKKSWGGNAAPRQTQRRG